MYLPNTSSEDRRDGLFWFHGSPSYLLQPDFYGNPLKGGFAYHLGQPKSRSSVLDARYYWVIVPWWAACVPMIVPAAYWMLRRKRRRAVAGLCRSCGYDLRATPDRCPECGTEPKAKRGQASARGIVEA
jgi:hypothetical protein